MPRPVPQVFDDPNLQRLYVELRQKGKTKAAAVRIVQNVEKKSAGATPQKAPAAVGGRVEVSPPAPVQPDTSSHYPRKTSDWVRPNRISEEIPHLLSTIESKQEGYRVGVIGETGCGKTSALKILLSRRWNGITLIHDEKPARVGQFHDLKVKHATTDICSLNHLRGIDANTVVFRGDPMKRTSVPVDAVAELAIQMAQMGIPVRLVIDELDRAVSDGGKVLASQSVRFCITQGRALGLSVLWSTQMPMRTPAELLDNSSVLIMGRMGPKSANYLTDRQHFGMSLTEQIQHLKGHYEFNDGPGELVIYQNGKKWDNRVYLNE